MALMKTIWVISGSRADFNLNRWVIEELQKHDEFHIVSIGLQGVNKYEMDIDCLSSNLEIIGRLVSDYAGNCISRIGSWFNSNKIDYVLVLGDRWEILQVAIAAKLYDIPIIHLGGGEVSEGSYDNDFRACISQLSKYHFVVTENCKRNLAKLNITDNVYVVGSPRLDCVDRVEYNHDILDKYSFDKNKKIGLVIYHPETKNLDSIEESAYIFFGSLMAVDMQHLIIYPNHDNGSEIIIEIINRLKGDNIVVVETLKHSDYLSFLNVVDVMIGNSSAGIMETASYRLPTVNVGDRQKGRECNVNVVHVGCERNDIIVAVEDALSTTCKNICAGVKNKFGDGRASEKIVEIIRSEL